MPQRPAAATALATPVTEKTRSTREKLKEEYGLTADAGHTRHQAHGPVREDQVERAYIEREIANKHLEDELKNAATDAEAQAVEAKRAEREEAFKPTTSRPSSTTTTASIVPESSPARRPRRSRSARTSRWTTRAPTCAASPGRSHCSSWPTATATSAWRTSTTILPDDVFEEITGITESDFRLLRDGQGITEDNGMVTKDPRPLRRSGLRPGDPGIPGEEGLACRLLR